MNFTSEDIFNSVSTIVNQAISNLAFDRTVIATIIDDSGKKNGHYVVYDGSVKFVAYGDSSYKKNEQVRIQVPNGDFTGTKFIAGKYISDSSMDPIVYKATLDDVLDLTGNLFADGDKANGITATCSDDNVEQEKLLGSINLSNSEYLDIRENGIFDTLYLSAEFKSNFEQVISIGNYGLKLELYSVPEESRNQNLEDNFKEFKIKELSLDSSLFFGDPYAFPIYSKQIAKFDTSNMANVTDIKIYLYQKNNFKQYDNKPIVSPNSGLIIKNIFVKNINIGFGMSINNIADNTVKLYSPDSLFFNEIRGDRQKNIGLLWINKDEYDNFIGFSDGIYDLEYNEIDELINERAGKENRYSIYWYKYRHGYNPTKDAEENENNKSAKYFSKMNWQRLDLIDGQNSINTGLPNEYFKADDNKIYFDKKSKNYFKIDLDIGAKEEQIMALVVYNHQAYFSEPITFTNALGDNVLELRHGENSYADYLLYGKDNRLLNSGETYKKRKIEIAYENLMNLEAANIYWYIPKEKYTMIKGIDSQNFKILEETSEDFLYNKNFYNCYYKLIEGQEDYSLSYYIKDYLSNLQNRNTIYCVIKNSFQGLSAQINLTFGNYEDTLNDYNVQLTPVGSEVGAISKDKPLKMKLTVSNREEELVPLFTQLDSEIENGVYFPYDLENEMYSNIKFLGNIAYTITNQTTPEFDEDGKEKEKKEIYFEVAMDSAGSEESIEINTYSVLMVTIEPDYQQSFSGYYPIPYSSGDYYIEGASTIIYDNKGQNPQYYKKPFKIYDKASQKQIEDVHWEVKILDASGYEIDLENFDLDVLTDSYLPSLDAFNNLLVSNQYLENNNFNVLIVCYDKDNKILWKQPIFIMVDQSGVLNKSQASRKNLVLTEDGSSVNIELGRISSTDNSTYSGTFLGEVGTSETDEQQQSNFGLFCYYDGEQRAQINADRIYFKGMNNGNSLYIDTLDQDYPIKFVNDNNENTFAIDWKGNIVSKTGVSADENGNVKLGEKLSVNADGTINLGSKVRVDASGNIILTSGNNIEFKISTTDSGGFSFSRGTKTLFTVDNSGKATISNVTFNTNQYYEGSPLTYTGTITFK